MMFHYVNTLIQELGATKTYERTSSDEKSVVNSHCCHIIAKFAVGIKENQEQLARLYWLPKLHKRTYKARFIANSSSCTTTVLSKLLTSCLTAVKQHVIKYSDTIYARSFINLFWSIKILPKSWTNLNLKALWPLNYLLKISPRCILRIHITLLRTNLLP